MIVQLKSTEYVDALHNLETLCFDSEAWSKKALAELFESTFATVLAYTINEQVVAYISYFAIADEMQIATVAVHPDFRRQGIASKLIERAEECAKQNGCTIGELEVNTKNFNAVSLYQKMGYSAVGIRKNFYPKDVTFGSKDGYTMIKQL
ncbi:MAG: ribosomal protein S18-alanine N-acetyltransferase [Clostridia bacterium]|nr:ribosomal protein S18-alanine N-acetyltransferase [Clostridia bacterium]